MTASQLVGCVPWIDAKHTHLPHRFLDGLLDAELGLREERRLRTSLRLLPIARAKLSLEVRRPDVVGLLGHKIRCAGMFPRVAPAPALDQAASLQQVASRARRRELEPRVSLHEPRQQLPGSPAWLLTPRLHQRSRHPSLDAMRTVSRCNGFVRRAPRLLPRSDRATCTPVFRLIP